jgi:hypothetical protein
MFAPGLDGVLPLALAKLSTICSYIKIVLTCNPGVAVEQADRILYADRVSSMSKYDYLSIIKRRAKVVRKEQGISLSKAQMDVAIDAGFASFHELQAVAKSKHSDSRLLLAALGLKNLSWVVDAFDLSEVIDELVEDHMSGAIAETNAYGFEVDDLSVTDVAYCEVTGTLSIQLSILYAGEQDPDRMYSGTKFYLDALLRLCLIGNTWMPLFHDSFEVIGGKSDQELDWEEQAKEGLL